MLETSNQDREIIIFEGAQGSGKTSSATYLSEYGFLFIRGIPHSQKLVSNREAANWQEAKDIILYSTGLGRNVAIDRSIWSLVAFYMRIRPDYAQLVCNLGLEHFRRAIRNQNYTLVILTSFPEQCYERKIKEDDGIMLIDPVELQREMEIYETLYENWTKNGLSACKIINTSTKDTLHAQLREKLNIPLLSETPAETELLAV